MTTFGAPIQREDDALRAVRTAVAMRVGMRDFQARHPELGRPLEIGIGIHTGEVTVGNIGSARRLDYTVIGDNVNLSARIEGLTKHYGCPILISESTLSALGDIPGDLRVREVDLVVVSGRTRPIRVFELLG